jgi:hypothetical protein
MPARSGWACSAFSVPSSAFCGFQSVGTWATIAMFGALEGVVEAFGTPDAVVVRQSSLQLEQLERLTGRGLDEEFAGHLTVRAWIAADVIGDRLQVGRRLVHRDEGYARGDRGLGEIDRGLDVPRDRDDRAHALRDEAVDLRGLALGVLVGVGELLLHPGG